MRLYTSLCPGAPHRKDTHVVVWGCVCPHLLHCASAAPTEGWRWRRCSVCAQALLAGGRWSRDRPRERVSISPGESRICFAPTGTVPPVSDGAAVSSPLDPHIFTWVWWGEELLHCLQSGAGFLGFLFVSFWPCSSLGPSVQDDYSTGIKWPLPVWDKGWNFKNHEYRLVL